MAGYTLLQEEAYTHIKEQILSGALREEQIYSETKIAAMIGISRTPVKDALVRLSQERLVDILPAGGSGSTGCPRPTSGIPTRCARRWRASAWCIWPTGRTRRRAGRPLRSWRRASPA
ncbi:MAG: GntR family transcriptional regulator [Dysosmobacter sp.]